MFRILPNWVSKLKDDLENAVDEIAYDYGIDRQTMKDSASIKASISNIIDNFEYIANLQRADLKPQMWYEDRKFGAKREKVNAEEKTERRNFERRSKKKSKSNK